MKRSLFSILLFLRREARLFNGLFSADIDLVQYLCVVWLRRRGWPLWCMDSKVNSSDKPPFVPSFMNTGSLPETCLFVDQTTLSYPFGSEDVNGSAAHRRVGVTTPPSARREDRVAQSTCRVMFSGQVRLPGI